jgi:hypothetical protein
MESLKAVRPEYLKHGDCPFDDLLCNPPGKASRIDARDIRRVVRLVRLKAPDGKTAIEPVQTMRRT